MNFSDLQDELYNWIFTETGITTIWQFANAPRPSRPYLLLFIPTITPIGSTSYSKVDDAGIIKILSQNIMTLAITYFGIEEASSITGQQIISQILLSTKKEYVNQIFRQNNIGYLTRLAQNNIQNQLSTSFEEQISLDLSFMLLTDIIDDVGLINSVEIMGEYLDANGDVTNTTTITVES